MTKQEMIALIERVQRTLKMLCSLTDNPAAKTCCSSLEQDLQLLLTALTKRE